MEDNKNKKSTYAKQEPTNFATSRMNDDVLEP